MKKEELARYIDYTILKQDAKESDVDKLCENARKYNFKAVCISPCYVKKCKDLLKDSETLICTVIGFPHGLNTANIKIAEGLDAIQNGADELDVVVNNSFLKSGKFNLVENELKKFCETIKTNNYNIVIKIIVETCLLNEEEKIAISKIVLNSGADFIKTSTGFSTGGATVEDIKLIRSVVGEKFLIKASGGIRDYEGALSMIKAGANRLGVSKVIEIIEEAE